MIFTKITQVITKPALSTSTFQDCQNSDCLPLDLSALGGEGSLSELKIVAKLVLHPFPFNVGLHA